MLSHFVRTVCIATLMGCVGIYVVHRIATDARLPVTIALSFRNAIWLIAGAQLYRTPTVALGPWYSEQSRPSSARSLSGSLQGTPSGGLWPSSSNFLALFPFPIGLLTGYLVFRSASYSRRLARISASA